MGNIRKLPFLSGCAAAVLAGIISFAAGADNQTIYIRMAVMMFLFYMIGLLVKKTVVNTQRELENRKREQELKEARQKKKMKEEMMKKMIESRKDAARNASETEPDMAEALNMDEFRALSQMILTKEKE
jgi:cytochrome c oxidase assembly factor CtaG